MNTYDQFERERLRLLSEMDKFMEKQQQIRYSFSGRPFDPNTGTYLSQEEEQEQKPMTREEAERKVSEVGGINLDAAKWVRVFEALGLLKFDEVKKPDCNNVYKVTKEVLEAIKSILQISNKNDFVITKVGDFVVQKVDEVKKKQVEWRHALGNVCWFSEGYDPNKSDSGWRRVDERDCRDIWVGTHLVLAYQAVEGLKSLGYKIVRNNS